jgi:hypothetical protein
MIKTFRGMIADGGFDTIALHTTDGSIGYRIVKLEVLPNNIQSGSNEALLVVSKVAFASDTPPSLLNLNDNTIVAAVMFLRDQGTVAITSESIIVDNEIFNQDIYVGYQDGQGSAIMNYYLELEQVKLDLSENTVATLKDIRNVTAVTG